MNVVARPLIGKIVLKGIIRSETGLHIGTSKEVLEIGGMDNPVLKNPVTSEPYIPGSSLKGKLRSILERKVAIESDPQNPASFFKEGTGKGRNIGTRNNPVLIHVCGKKEDAINCPVCRLFGSSADRNNPGSNFPARLYVRDALLTSYTKAKLQEAETDFLYTELKYENALDRITAAANPRPIERVPPLSDFAFEFVYNVENPQDVATDLGHLFVAIGLLENDALGGHGSRGSGKIKIYWYSLAAMKADYFRNFEEKKKIDFLEQALVAEKTLRAETAWEEHESTVQKWPATQVASQSISRFASFFTS